jgi:hypothetical protein
MANSEKDVFRQELSAVIDGLYLASSVFPRFTLSPNLIPATPPGVAFFCADSC